MRTYLVTGGAGIRYTVDRGCSYDFRILINRHP